MQAAPPALEGQWSDVNKRVVVTDHAFRDVEVERAMAIEAGAEFACFACKEEAETADAVGGADVVFVNFAPITRSVLDRMKPGAVVIRYGIGYDNVDTDAAHALGIQVANVPDYGAETVADHAVASLLMLARRLPIYNERIRQEGWILPGEVGPIRGLRSTVVGLIGMGRIAQEVCRRLRPFGVSFVGHDPYCSADIFDSLDVERVSLHALARRSHAISLHAPNTPATQHTIDDDFLALVQKGTILVNTARGPLVDERALISAVRDGRVVAAALDVTDPEPVPPDSPLRTRPEIIFTPHAAFYDEDSLRNLQQLASEEAGRALRREPLRCRIT